MGGKFRREGRFGGLRRGVADEAAAEKEVSLVEDGGLSGGDGVDAVGELRVIASVAQRSEGAFDGVLHGTDLDLALEWRVGRVHGDPVEIVGGEAVARRLAETSVARPAFVFVYCDADNVKKVETVGEVSFTKF